ncbi:MAG: glutathione S-transferase family protein [Anaerolineae bacterium]|nr:glutathione S-transferase family protein [Gloeobacterales cyanobacterium ES-bin-313]
MERLTLVIANKNYSSWSLRPWLAMRQAGIPFTEILISLAETPEAKAVFQKYSPSRRVPVLIDGDLTLWESIAICEYVAEQFPLAQLWPREQKARAVARTISAEMHSGFVSLRQNMPMDIRARHPGEGLTPDVGNDIARITTIWRECRTTYGGEGKFLFGHFTIADAMFAPVVTRFVTYGVEVDGISEQYQESILALEAMRAWSAAAQAETETVPNRL